MDILVGADRQWGNVGYVALIDRAKTVRANSIQELAHVLYTLGLEGRSIHLAEPDDGDRAMSLHEHAEFRAAWLTAATNNPK